MLREGDVDLGAFTPAQLNDPKLMALAERITVIADDNLDLAAFVPAFALARLMDGTMLRVDVKQQFGSPEWPRTLDEQLEKARRCFTLGGLKEGLVPQLHALVMRLNAINDVAGSLARTLG